MGRLQIEDRRQQEEKEVDPKEERSPLVLPPPQEVQDRHDQPQAIIKVERTTRCAMTRHLMLPQPPANVMIALARVFFAMSKGAIHPQLTRYQHWRHLWELEVQMSTPSRSRSSTMGNEDYFNWRENMERRQRESKRQVQALLYQTRRLKEENKVLRIQVSSSAPPRRMRNSRQNEEATYPRNVDFLHAE
ncbi:hypothetical protein AAG906_036858 [Vitis piasezkii]